MKLTNDEKKYLWSKIEYKKKRKAIETENELFQLLHSEGGDISDDEFTKILNSLEYSFKKKLREGTMKNDNFLSIQKKLPSTWIGVKFGNIKARQKRLNKKPTQKSKKSEIIDYLKKNNIDFDEKYKKSDLIKLFKNENIKTFYGFNLNS